MSESTSLTVPNVTKSWEIIRPHGDYDSPDIHPLAQAAHLGYMVNDTLRKTWHTCDQTNIFVDNHSPLPSYQYIIVDFKNGRSQQNFQAYSYSGVRYVASY